MSNSAITASKALTEIIGITSFAGCITRMAFCADHSRSIRTIIHTLSYITAIWSRADHIQEKNAIALKAFARI